MLTGPERQNHNWINKIVITIIWIGEHSENIRCILIKILRKCEYYIPYPICKSTFCNYSIVFSLKKDSYAKKHDCVVRTWIQILRQASNTLLCSWRSTGNIIVVTHIKHYGCDTEKALWLWHTENTSNVLEIRKQMPQNF